jgi:hypothetical protein
MNTRRKEVRNPEERSRRIARMNAMARTRPYELALRSATRRAEASALRSWNKAERRRRKAGTTFISSTLVFLFWCTTLALLALWIGTNGRMFGW